MRLHRVHIDDGQRNPPADTIDRQETEREENLLTQFGNLENDA